MKIGFDLDGTLDRPGVLELAKAMLKSGHEVHIISGCFLESGTWQGRQAKFEKLERLGLVMLLPGGTVMLPPNLFVEILDAVDHEKFDRDYRLADLGLRKGAYVERHGIALMFDDSELYCKLMPAYCGAAIAHVR